MADAATANPDASRLLLHNRPFLLFCSARIAATLAYQMLAVAVGWQVYALTRSAFYLGMVGLVQFVPMVLLTLVVGHVADRYNRRLIVSICQVIEALGVLVLAAGNSSGWLTKESILVIMALLGAVRAFEGPTLQALMPNLVTTGLLPRAAAWVASGNQSAIIVGPALGGFLYVYGPTLVYAIIGLLFFGAGLLMFVLHVEPRPSPPQPFDLKSVFAGLAFIRSRAEILGAISLDLFAVLLGGATALLPIYAREILSVGPLGLGFLRAAPAVGALLMSVVLAHRPPQGRVGRTMFRAVVVFGLGTIVFGISKSFVLSILALIVLGAADIISVVIRAALVQIRTPDEMRGRVSAVNLLFIGTSNQLGEFESGLTASWFGVVPSVLIGGVGTIVVAGLWMRLFPSLRDADRLEG